MGPVPSFSIPEGVNCPGATPLCRRDCYFKFMRLRLPRLGKTLIENDHIVKNDIDWINRLKYAIVNQNCRYFRLHVGGDFFCQSYLDGWIEICQSLPDIKFLAFTKSVSLDYTMAPDNLNIIWSIFPDTIMSDVPPGPRAYTAIPDIPYAAGLTDGAIRCAGLCVSCGVCFHSNDNQTDVVFDAHGGRYNGLKT